MTPVLQGIRVLDFGRYIAGPYCATLLAEYGAEVIRIEKREGSEDRFVAPVGEGGEGALFLQMNRNKLSLTVDPMCDEGREVVRRLVRTADVVVANLPHQSLVAMGLDDATLRAIKPDLILTTSSAFGSAGPMAKYVGFDGVGQAMSGAVYMTGEPGQPYRAAVNWVDFGTALHCAFGTLAAWACDVLNLLTGNLDRAGGVMFPSPIHEPRSRAARSFQVGRWKSRVRGLDEAFGELPVATLVDEIETGGAGQIQALITVAGNPVLTTPEGDRLGRALAGLEFMVSVDPYLNETTRHADVILPPPSALERSHYDLAFASLVVHNHARYSPAVFPATGPSEFEILVTLTGIVMGMGPETDPSDLADAALLQQIAAATTVPGSPIEGREPQELMAMLDRWEGAEKTLDFMIRMGAGGDGFGRDPDGWTLDAIVAQPHGVDRGPLVERLPGILATASGKIELAPPPLLADVARLEAAMGEAPPALVLVGRRDLRSNNSWLHNVEVLVKGKERCTMQIHPDDAERLGLVDGEAATVTSRAGTLEVPVSVTEDIAPGVVSIPYGWGHDQPETRLSVASRRPGVNVNRLTDGSIIDPLSGNAVLNGIPVSVTPVG